MRSKLGEDDDEPLLLFVPSCPSSSVITFAGADIVGAVLLGADGGRHSRRFFEDFLKLQEASLISWLYFRL